MKHIILFIAAVFSLALFSCKKEKGEQVTVVRDCTGTYLRLNNQDYHVCNLEKTASFADGAVAQATFKKIGECKGSAKDEIVCFMLHSNQGWIEVEEIN